MKLKKIDLGSLISLNQICLYSQNTRTNCSIRVVKPQSILCEIGTQKIIPFKSLNKSQQSEKYCFLTITLPISFPFIEFSIAVVILGCFGEIIEWSQFTLLWKCLVAQTMNCVWWNTGSTIYCMAGGNFLISYIVKLSDDLPEHHINILHDMFVFVYVCNPFTLNLLNGFSWESRYTISWVIKKSGESIYLG